MHLRTEYEVTRYMLDYLGLPVTRLGVLRWWMDGGTFAGAVRMWRSLP